MPTRRTFLSASAATAALASLPSCTRAAAPEPGKAIGPLLNHVGFTPSALKVSLIAAGRAPSFELLDATGKVVRQGPFTAKPGDLGDYALADFSDLRTPGTYTLRAGSATTSFTIAPEVYAPAMRAAFNYFAKQRCGDSKTGWHAPCHLDDGRRLDDHTHLDATGGWHDACDLRKWVDATIYGLIGLSRALDAVDLDRNQILDELRWGNAYFRKMQSADGYVMNYCGGDDGNRWTDNQIGTADDRPVHTEPADLPAQFHFIAAQASLARRYLSADVGYSGACLAAAHECMNWCTNQRNPGAALSLAAAISACCELAVVTKGDAPQDQAAAYLRKLLALQVTRADDNVRGYFLTAPDRHQPLRDIHHGNLPLIALCDALTAFPKHPEAPKWRDALDLHVEHLLAMADRSPFGIVPFGLYDGPDPGGARRIGNHFYRYTMKRHGETAAKDWWVGINAHLASHGVGLIRASRLTGDPRLAAAAQRQLDWILGANPFNVSTVTGVGRNQPTLYRTNAFKPTTPEISGGVMNGLGGTDLDEICLNPSSWNTCEYWTPMVGYTLWLLAELQKSAA